MRIIIVIGLILFNTLSGQVQPKEIKIPKKQKTTYISTLTLPNGEKVRKFSIKRPKKCMDCISGIVYLDSVDNVVARITQGFALRVFVKEGYEKEWFTNH